MDVLNTILSSSRTVFTPQWLALMDSSRSRESIYDSLRYYARTGALRSPRSGIYTKSKYDEQEMACALLKPCYISLDYVLARAGEEDVRCDQRMQPPYDGAKPHYVISDVDDRDYVSLLVKTVAESIKSKKK